MTGRRPAAITREVAYGEGVRRSHAATPDVHRITAARRPHSDDLDARIHRYLVSMGIRTACVVLAIVTGGVLRWTFVACAAVLPYIAVVMANAGWSRRESLRPVPPRTQARSALPADVAHAADGDASGSEHRPQSSPVASPDAAA